MSSCIFVIDMQNDFVRKDGKLSVYANGGEEAVRNAADFMERNKDKLDKLFFSQDCHPIGHIGSTLFWIDTKALSNVAPYTMITSKDVEDGKYASIVNKEILLPYMKKMEENGIRIIAWPPHCIENTFGSELCYEFNHILAEYLSKVEIIKKGNNTLIEQYSPIVSNAMLMSYEVVNVVNKNLLDELTKYDTIYVCGVATDFCVKNTINDIICLAKEIVPKIVILKDCMAAVSKDFIIEENEVYKKAIELGAKVIDSKDIC